jgi:integrase
MIALRQMQGELVTGRPPADTTLDGLTLEQWYRRHYQPQRLPDRNPHSWSGKQRLHIERYILPEFASKRLAEITLYHVEHWYADLLRTVSRRYANHIAATFTTMVRRAIGAGIQAAAGRSDLFISRLGDFKRRPNPRTIPTVLTHEQVGKVIEALEGNERALIELWIQTGLRLGEMQWLQWGDIDLRAGVLHVRAKEGHPIKDNEDRTLPLPSAAVDMLKMQHETRRSRATDWYYPAVSNHEKRFSSTLINHVRKLFRQAGITASAVVLRHTYASMLLSQGCPPFELMKYMGHASIQTTQRHYAAFMPPTTSAVHGIDFGLGGRGKSVLEKLSRVQ